MTLTRTALLRHFQLHRPAPYHAESLQRLSSLPSHSLREAAVLIGFVERPSGLHILFTRRSPHLRHHPGQISFPGGKKETEDSSLAAAALRETDEEIGISPQQIEVFGSLPPLPTISRFAVTPILAFIDPDYSLQIEPNEVDEVFEVPADFILNPQNLFSQRFLFRTHLHRIFAIPYQRHFIWGVTAQIIQAMQTQLIGIQKSKHRKNRNEGRNRNKDRKSLPSFDK